MTQKFQASVHHRDDVTFIKLSGVIDEDNELNEISEQVSPSGTAVIDLGEVERINSCGVRDWVNWLGRVESRNTNCVLVECSPAIVAQINLVNNFTGSGVVKSFYVPYFCPECDEEKVLLVETADMGPPPHEPPTCRCDECDLVMDFDDMPDSYFAFLSNQKKVAQPEKINEVLSEFQNTEGEKSKIRSRVGHTSSKVSISSISSISSLPSVPSLPSISRTNIGGTQTGSGVGAFTPQPSYPQYGQPGTRPGGNMSPSLRPLTNRPPLQRPTSGVLVPVLLVVLVAAIGVLIFLLSRG